MGLIEIIKSGFSKPRLITIVYMIQLILAMTIGLQVYQVIGASIGNSLSLEGLKLVDAHMVINDLLNTHGASLSPLLGQVRWMVIVYLIVAAFVHGGIWYSLIKEYNKTSVWIGGSTYFLKMLVIGIIMSLIFIIWSGLLWGPYLSKIRYWMEHLPSEEPILWGGIAITVLWSFGSIFIFVASCSCKILVIRDQKKVATAIFQGIKASFRKTWKLLPVLFVFFLVLALLYLVHSFVDDWSFLSTTIGVLILFLIQQLIVWIKIGLRISTFQYLKDRL